MSVLTYSIIHWLVLHAIMFGALLGFVRLYILIRDWDHLSRAERREVDIMFANFWAIEAKIIEAKQEEERRRNES